MKPRKMNKLVLGGICIMLFVKMNYPLIDFLYTCNKLERNIADMGPVEHIKLFRKLNLKVIVENQHKLYSPILCNGAIVIANHHTILEGSAICAVIDLIKARMCSKVLTAKVLFPIKVVDRYILNLVDGVKLVKNASETISKALTPGRFLLIFPSGSIVATKFKPGFLVYATRRNLPIMPVWVDFHYPFIFQQIFKSLAIFNQNLAEKVCIYLGFFFYQKKTLRIRFGDPIPADYDKYQDVLQKKRRFTQAEIDIYRALVDSISKDKVESRYVY